MPTALQYMFKVALQSHNTMPDHELYLIYHCIIHISRRTADRWETAQGNQKHSPYSTTAIQAYDSHALYLTRFDRLIVFSRVLGLLLNLARLESGEDKKSNGQLIRGGG